MTKLIIYACPVGGLAKQIEVYLSRAEKLYGPNAAHAYMPHCTLTGFFEDEQSAIPNYTQTLSSSLDECRDRIPTPPVQIKQLRFQSNWHGLEIEADWLKQLIADFAQKSSSPTCHEALRLKDWLHLSLAYEFEAGLASGLKQLANDLIDIASEVSWELKFYERLSAKKSVSSQASSWKCHGRWALSGRELPE